MLRDAKAIKTPRWAVFVVLCLAGVVLATPAGASNDPLYPQQWALEKIQAEAAWADSRGDGIKVAVVDTGVDFGHEDLAGKSAGSFNCIKSGGTELPCDPVPGGDDNGHGTQVAGIIAANEGNGKGIAPVAPGAMIMSFKALASDGSGALSDVLRAIRSAADNGAQVINLSLGPEVNLINDLLNLLFGGDPKQEFADTFKYAADKGALVIAAAGNSGTSSFFSGLDNVYVVGSTGPNDEVAFYSSSGAEIFAPGGNSNRPCDPSRCINTTSAGGYKAVQGTSFAAPHVSGAAALVVAQGLTAPRARARITEAADVLGVGRRLNASRAVANTAAPLPPPPKPAPPPAPVAPEPPKPTPSPPAAVEITVPGLPILLLSSSAADQAPDLEQAAARRTETPEGSWAWTLAAVLGLLTAAGHVLFRVSASKGI